MSDLLPTYLRTCGSGCGGNLSGTDPFFLRTPLLSTAPNTKDSWLLEQYLFWCRFVIRLILDKGHNRFLRGRKSHPPYFLLSTVQFGRKELCFDHWSPFTRSIFVTVNQTFIYTTSYIFSHRYFYFYIYRGPSFFGDKVTYVVVSSFYTGAEVTKLERLTKNPSFEKP